jgi:hypothetical protein
MKMQITTSPLITSEDMDSSVMGMDSSGMDQACYFLRDKIYTNKILAVVREYISNALDEHIKYNVQTPVSVNLTTTDFSVRDYAKGLDETEIRNIFGMYFKSTKRTNNNQSGMFGLGSKSAHCYTDSFFVKSFYNNVCTLYSCTLGGGDNGVSVGQIFKISEEPTTETGIEISLNIKPEDYYKFVSYAKRTTMLCSSKIKLTVGENVYEPLTPISVINKKGFLFKIYDYPFENAFDDKSVIYQMGNVSYNITKIDSLFGKDTFIDISKERFLVIDIPIGKMSLPISRESFENTASNNRVLDEIKNLSQEIYEEEFAPYKNLEIEELLSKNSEYFVKGEFFTVHKKRLYPDLFPLIQHIKTVESNTVPFEQKKNKKIIALIPNKESADYWVSKFHRHVNSINKNYYYVNEKFLNLITDQTLKSKLEDYFLFKSVKSSIFNWPKSDKSDSYKTEKSYTVKYSENRSYYKRTYNGTSLQIHNIMADNFLDKKAENKAEALSQLKAIDWNKKTLKFLNSFTITKSTTCPGCVYTQSTSIVKSLKELGWFELHSPEHLDALTKVKKYEEELREKEILQNNIRIKFLEKSTNERILEKVNKKTKYLEKFSKIIDNVKNGNNLRSKIFNSLQDSFKYYDSVFLNRKELRKILNIK